MLYYLAHPVSGDSEYTFEENKAHTLKILRILHDAGMEVVCPWYTDLCYLSDDNPDERMRALKRNCEVVRKIGNVILAGHKISRGMRMEVSACEGQVINIIGIRDDELAEYVKTHYV